MNLNNKGMTIVEILVCFLLVTFITVSLFTTVSSFNNKRSIESVKSDLLQYRNDIDKMLEDDLIHKGLINAKVPKPKNVAVNGDANLYGYQTVYTADLYFRDGSSKRLTIVSQRAGEYGSESGSADTCTKHDDLFYIEYGTLKSDGTVAADNLRYSLPDVGSFVNEACTPHETIKDLRFNTIKVSNADNVLFIYINFYHPELGNDYSINIVAPINYFG